MRRLLYLTLLLLLLGACNEHTVYHQFRSLPTDGWRPTDTLSFDVAVSDSATQYDLLLQLRSRNNYPYRALSLRITCTGPDSLPCYRQDLSVPLADSTGRFTGHGAGTLYQYTFPGGKLPISNPGTYHIRIHHLLHDSLLPGINDIGIKIADLHLYAGR